MRDLKYSVYKSLETDDEFAERVRQKHPWYGGTAFHHGEALDDSVWCNFRMQRRIVERSTEPAPLATSRSPR